MPRSVPPNVLVVPAALLALACAAAPEEEDAGPVAATTHAIVTVERSDPAAEGDGSASAVARFLWVGPGEDPARVLGTAGAALDLPSPYSCSGADDAPELEPPRPSLAPVEFLAAGDVTLTAGGSSTQLLPHAFPTVGAYASGVLYATRDRATEALPRGATYHVAVSGSPEVPPLTLQVEAPDAPAEPRVDGADLRELGALRGGRPIEVEWTPGDPSDLVFVELLSLDGQVNLVCSFPDEAGAGTLPAITAPAAGAARIALHRLRTRRFVEGAARVSEVRFDFSVGRTVDLSR